MDITLDLQEGQWRGQPLAAGFRRLWHRCIWLQVGALEGEASGFH